MAKIRAYGSDAGFLAAFESTYGTPPDGSAGGVYTKLPFKEHGVGAEKPLGYDPLLGEGRDAQDPFYEAVTVEGDIIVPLDLRGIGFWLRGLFGAPVTANNGDGSFDHVFTSGGELPSLALQVGHSQLSTQHHLMHAGCKLDGISFDMARTGPANASVSVVAQGETVGTTAADTSPLSYLLSRFSQGRGSIKVGGSQLANVTGGRFSFSNNLERVETIRSDGLIDGADETEAMAEGSVTVRFSTDTALSDAITAETPIAMVYEYSAPGSEGYKLSLSLPRVFLPRKKNEIRGPGGIQVSYDWRAAKDAVAGHMCQVTLVNDVASY